MTDTLKQRAEKSYAEFGEAVADARVSNATSSARWIGEARALIYEQRERIAVLEAECEAAANYIAESPHDPVITYGQEDAWRIYSPMFDTRKGCSSD